MGEGGEECRVVYRLPEKPTHAGVFQTGKNSRVRSPNASKLYPGEGKAEDTGITESGEQGRKDQNSYRTGAICSFLCFLRKDRGNSLNWGAGECAEKGQ